MYSEHPSEFPLDQLPATLDPVLLAAAVLLLVLVAVVAWAAGRRAGAQASTDGDRRRREHIHKAVHEAAQAAMKANRPEVIGKAEALSGAIGRHLGDVLALTGSLAAADDLKRALNGQAAAAGHGQGGHEAPGVGPIIINSGKLVLGRDGEAEDAPHGPPAAPVADHPLSHDETVAAVRQAVARFADHWADRAARLDELRRAQARLTGSG